MMDEDLKKAFEKVIDYCQEKTNEDRPRAKMTLYSVTNYDALIVEYLEQQLELMKNG